MRLNIGAAIVFICLCYGCNKRSDADNVNTFLVNKIRFSLDNCVLACKPEKGILRCEIDLSCCNIGNPYIPTDQIDIRNFIWFSIRYIDADDLKEGIFICPRRTDSPEPEMMFSGSVTTEGTQINIRSGKLAVQKDHREIKLSFELRLDNHRRMTGNYTGPYTENNIISF